MRGGPGSFLDVWLIRRFLLWLNSRFLRSEAIAQCQKVIDFWGSAVRQLPLKNVKYEFSQNSVVLVHLFRFFDLRCSNVVENGWDRWVLTKLGDFIGKNANIWEILAKTVTKIWFCQNQASTDFFFKNEGRKLKFGLVIPIYGI